MFSDSITRHKILLKAITLGPVFPCHPNTKKPVFNGGYKTASVDRRAIKKWLNKNPNANFGIATGHVSDCFVLDVDDGAIGKKSLREFEKKYGRLPKTVVVQTSAGHHYYFRIPKGKVIKRLIKKVGKGLDIIGRGSYVMAAGSVHPDGPVYSYVDGLSPDDVEIPQAPRWLLKKIRKCSQRKHRNPRLSRDGVNTYLEKTQAHPRRLQAYGRKALAEELTKLSGAPNTTRNDSLNKAAFRLGQLVGSKVLKEAEVFRALQQAALAIGLEQGEIAPTIRSGLTAGVLQPRIINFKN